MPRLTSSDLAHAAKRFGSRTGAAPDVNGGASAQLRLINVLVVVPEGATRDAIAETLSSASRVAFAIDTDEAKSSLTQDKPDVVVALGSLCDRRFLDTVAFHGLSASTIFIANAEARAGLTKQLARGRSFAIVDEDDVPLHLLADVLKVAMPRSETRRSTRDLRVRFELSGREVDGELMDISNKGCAIRVAGFDGNAAMPGTILDNLWLTQGEEVLLAEVSGVVRHLRHGGPAGGFRVGVEFVPQKPRSEPPPRRNVVEEPLHIVATLDAVLEGETEISLTDAGSGTEVLRGPLAALDAVGKTVTLEGALETSFEAGDVVQGAFEHEGTQHQFWASIRAIESPRLVVGLPKALVSTRHRGVQRFRPRPDAPVRIAVRSPLSGNTVSTEAIDLTASSVSFPISQRADLFPIGTKIEDLELTFANGDTFRRDGVVRRLAPESDSGADSRLHCAIEFTDRGKRALGELAARIAMSSLPEVSTDLGVTPKQIWGFLEESGFLYPDKLARLDVSAVKKTMKRLVGTPNDVAKTWLVREDDKIVAHLSSVRLFSSMWGLQHLAAVANKRGGSWASLLNLALAEYCEQHPEIEWLRVAYRPNNKWPQHVFGRFAHRVTDPGLSDFRTLSYMVSPTDVFVPRGSDPDYEIRKFGMSDLGALEACIVANGESILLPSSDLSADRINMREVTDSYGRLNLNRRREILVAERNGEPRGFALLEISSPGLNLSELTNAVTFHCFEPDPDLVCALGHAARRRYRELGYERCVALGDGNCVDALTSQGFVKAKEYCQWIWHYTLLRPFSRYVSKSFP